jgi:hypothetical protein
LPACLSLQPSVQQLQPLHAVMGGNVPMTRNAYWMLFGGAEKLMQLGDPPGTGTLMELYSG